MREKKKAIFFAFFAAILYAISIPFSKILLQRISPTIMVGLLYLGSGIGMLFLKTFNILIIKNKDDNRFSKNDLLYLILMVILDVIAAILFMIGVKQSNPANVSLLTNFEIVATSLFAMILFREKISTKLWLAIVIITIASIILGFEGKNSFTFNKGSFFVLGGCLCYGLENNCTRVISNKSPTMIVIIKGLFSGVISIIIGYCIKEKLPNFYLIIISCSLGFVSYGLSVYFYVKAQKIIYAARTSAFYSVAPFIGVLFGIFITRQFPTVQFYIALVLMIASTVLIINKTLKENITSDISKE